MQFRIDVVVRFQIALVVALSASAAFAQSERRLDYTTSGAELSAIVKEIGKLPGQKLSVDRSLAKEIVVVSVNGVTASEFREKLADCVSGKWVEREGDAFELVADDVLSAVRRRQDQKAYARDIYARLDKSIERNRPMLLEEGGVGSHYGRETLTLRIAKLIPVSVYEDLLIGDRIVFSSNPNRLQRKLPDVSESFESFRRADKEKIIAEEAIQGRTAEVDLPPVSSFLLVLERRDREDLFLSFQAIGDNGTVVSTTFTSAESLEPAMAPPSAEGAKIAWSTVALEIARVYSRWTSHAIYGLAPLPDAVIDSFRDPVSHEPLSYAFGTGMLALAKERKANVIATISDMNFGGALGFARNGLVTGEFWRLLNARQSIHATDSNGWIIVRPTDPISARESRGDRRALRDLIAGKGSRLYPTLDSLAAFAHSAPAISRISEALVVPFYAVVATDSGHVGAALGIT
ncbi:MAG: hypothetical protein H0W86_02775, partial [Armatimonadetes bacterium]|nr:hypothetical protein [Armatimonadota bacterium]